MKKVHTFDDGAPPSIASAYWDIQPMSFAMHTDDDTFGAGVQAD